MKKLLLVVTAFMAFQGVEARSIMGTSLSFQRVQKSDQSTVHSLQVYVDGTVVDRGRRLGDFKVVTRLSGVQMDRINRLLRRARPVVKVRIPSMAMCFAPSFTTDKYSADNYSLFLKEGAICDGGFTINKRPAAKKLTLILETLEQAAHRDVSLGDVDRQVEALLE